MSYQDIRLLKKKNRFCFSHLSGDFALREINVAENRARTRESVTARHALAQNKWESSIIEKKKLAQLLTLTFIKRNFLRRKHGYNGKTRTRSKQVGKFDR